MRFAVDLAGGPAAILGALILLCGCGLPLANHHPADEGAGPAAVGPLSAEVQYAGEVLAYMMRVVLGRAGDLDRHMDWRRQGLDVPLDLEAITAAMRHPERPKSDLMVMDASLVGLSEVLYDYNPRLNLFKGRFAFHSPYPSAELIALRLLLLGKLDRGERLRLSAIIDSEADLLVQGAGLPARQLAEMGLNTDEAALLQAVYRSEPAFQWYYKSPPLVAAMNAMGLLIPEAVVTRTLARDDYAAWRRPPDRSLRPKVRVAVLPSMVPGFRNGGGGGLTAPEAYLTATAKLKRSLENAVSDKLAGANTADLVVQLFQERPFALHPLNAHRHLDRLCPEADLAIIVLGRNVYRSMAFSPANTYAAQRPTWYLDLLDLKYGQAAAEIDAIATEVAQRLTIRPPTS